MKVIIWSSLMMTTTSSGVLVEGVDPGEGTGASGLEIFIRSFMLSSTTMICLRDDKGRREGPIPFSLSTQEKRSSVWTPPPPLCCVCQLLSLVWKQCKCEDWLKFFSFSVVAEFGRIALELLKRGASTKLYEGAASKNLSTIFTTHPASSTTKAVVYHWQQ